MDSIEREVESETDERLEDMDQSITVRQRRTIPFSEIAKVAFLRYPKRTALGLALFIGQAFLYNAFTFDLGTLLGEFFGVSPGSVPYYLALFGVSNFMGPFLLGRLFDTVGRRPMVSLCYLGSAGITVLLGALVAGGGLSKWGFMGLLLAAFFLASAGASSAYLTVSEIFPMETRALAVAFFYAVGTAAGGIAGPLLFGHLIDSGDTGQLAIGFFIGAAAMSLGGVAELLFGVEAAGKSLEDIAEPLSSQEGGGEERAVGDAADGRRRHRLGPSSPGSSRGWPVSDRVVAVSVEREVEAVAAAVADEGSLERRELARRVGAARWGPRSLRGGPARGGGAGGSTARRAIPGGRGPQADAEGAAPRAMGNPPPVPSFRPLSDYGIVADGRTAALVSSDGSIDWMCVPRFDGGSCFGRLLDAERGGHCSLSPAGEYETSREYVGETLVLATTFRAAGGEVRVLDCLLRPEDDDRGPQLLRTVEGVRGTTELGLEIAPRFDYGAVRPWIRRDHARQYAAIGGNDALVIAVEADLEVVGEHALRAAVTVREGERLRLLIGFAPPEEIDPRAPAAPRAEELDRRREATLAFWEDWTAQGTTSDPAVRRSALAIRALAFERTGAIVAAATTSLPEVVGGSRNWDYRFSWIRDSSFAVRSLAEVGYADAADEFRRFVARSAAGNAEDLQILFGVGGERRVGQQELDLEGWRGSHPVRVGNGAVDQLQLDAFGELVSLTWRWHERGHSPNDDHWRFLVSLVEFAAEHWDEPDSGLWEWPGDPLCFTHSRAMCFAALDRAAQLAEECGRAAPVQRWRQIRDEVREAVETRGYDSGRGVFTGVFDAPGLDAALLLLPDSGLLAWDDPRMVRTTDAIREELAAGPGLLYRYRRDDGLPGQEGAFLACSFWLVECLARQGRLSDAREVFDQAMATANDLGLFCEEWDPEEGIALGNLPQALTHLAHIGAAVALEQADRGKGGT